MKKQSLLLWTALATAAAVPALAAPVFEKGATVAPAIATKPVEFEVYLPLRNKDAMKSLLAAQQTVGSPQYHAWLTPAQFAAQFGPTPATIASAKAALAAEGLTVTATHSRSLHVVGDVGHTASLLHTTLNSVTAPSGSTRLVAMTKPTLSPALQAAGAKVLAFDAMRPRKPFVVKGPMVSTPQNRFTATGSYFFDDLKQAYGYPAYASSTKVGGFTEEKSLATGAGVNVAILMSDLIFPGDIPAAFNTEKFSAITGKPVPVVNTVLVDGGGSYNGPGSLEASLDTQQVTGGAPGSNVTLVSIPSLYDSYIIDGYSYIVEANIYDIVNSSFGECELYYTAAYNGGVDHTGTLVTEDEIYMQGNLQGITFVASSGDNGAPMCLGLPYFYGEPSTYVAGVSTPADDPNVTAVGGGNLVTSVGPGLSSTYVRESAYGDPEYPQDPYGTGVPASGGYWAAGGGVSQIWAKPTYQTLVATGSSTQRTVPDVGMQVGGLGFSNLAGEDPGFCDYPAISCSADDSSVLTAYGVGLGGGFYFTIGTSVSSPEFVGALALYEQKAGRQGNVNTFLYTMGAAQTVVPSKAYYHRGQQGFDGVYATTFPSTNYNYTYGNGSPDPINLFGLNADGLAGVPQTISNP